ncbi:hypothetical protein Tco_1155489 [Tanacetum coccineum]
MDEDDTNKKELKTLSITDQQNRISLKDVQSFRKLDIRVSVFTSAQDGKPLQDDVRLCLGDALKKAQDHNQRQVKDESKDHYPKPFELGNHKECTRKLPLMGLCPLGQKGRSGHMGYQYHEEETYTMPDRAVQPNLLSRGKLVRVCIMSLELGTIIARNYTQPKRPQNSDYFKDKMLVMQAQENGAVLDEEKLLFLAGEQGNTFDAYIDNQPVQDLALNEDNIFQADECDAFD